MGTLDKVLEALNDALKSKDALIDYQRGELETLRREAETLRAQLTAAQARK